MSAQHKDFKCSDGEGSDMSPCFKTIPILASGWELPVVLWLTCFKEIWIPPARKCALRHHLSPPHLPHRIAGVSEANGIVTGRLLHSRCLLVKGGENADQTRRTLGSAACSGGSLAAQLMVWSKSDAAITLSWLSIAWMTFENTSPRIKPWLQRYKRVIK